MQTRRRPELILKALGGFRSFRDELGLAAITYQARFLIEELKSITDAEYPAEARQMRDIFLCLAEYLVEQLDELRSPDDLLIARDDPEFWRTKALAELGQELYAHIRYLKASSPGQTPPGLQEALTQLTSLHFPTQANGTPVSLVRPQWKYNLACVLLTWHLRAMMSVAVLDPYGKLGVDGPDEILPVLWKGRQAKLHPQHPEHPEPLVAELPNQLAVLSFAGLDTYDPFLYPLLAHELGHFIDYSYHPPLHLREPLGKHLATLREDVLAVLRQTANGEPDEELVTACEKKLRDLISSCLRELLADLLATRMVGFAFFMAQSEFLKTIADWPQAIVEETGYPGIRFRLKVCFDHLTATENPGNIVRFLEAFSQQEPQGSGFLLKLLDRWRDLLAETSEISEGPRSSSDVTVQLQGLAAKAVTRALNDLHRVSRDVVPDDKCARLSGKFFERIRRLEHDVPPICSSEEGDCFAEIMSAAWAYQWSSGEQREAAWRKPEDQLGEYLKSCRLVLKAVELIPISQEAECKRTSAEPANEETDRDVQLKGVLSGPTMRQRMLRLGPLESSHLAVVPLNEKAIQGASLDVRLGNWFAIAKRTRLPAVNLSKKPEAELFMRIGMEEFFVSHGQSFLIHPGDLVLGTTLEFFGLPDDLMAFVEGKSTLGRMGLFVATATQVAPGFHGVIVLELANAGGVPLVLTPGMAIAQLVFQSLTEPARKEDLYQGPYQCQIKPLAGKWLR